MLAITSQCKAANIQHELKILAENKKNIKRKS